MNKKNRLFTELTYMTFFIGPSLIISYIISFQKFILILCVKLYVIIKIKRTHEINRNQYDVTFLLYEVIIPYFHSFRNKVLKNMS